MKKLIYWISQLLEKNLFKKKFDSLFDLNSILESGPYEYHDENTNFDFSFFSDRPILFEQLVSFPNSRIKADKYGQNIFFNLLYF